MERAKMQSWWKVVDLENGTPTCTATCRRCQTAKHDAYHNISKSLLSYILCVYSVSLYMYYPIISKWSINIHYISSEWTLITSCANLAGRLAPQQLYIWTSSMMDSFLIGVHLYQQRGIHVKNHHLQVSHKRVRNILIIFINYVYIYNYYI